MLLHRDSATVEEVGLYSSEILESMGWRIDERKRARERKRWRGGER